MRKIYLIYFLLVDDFKLVIIIELCPSHGNAHWLVWFKFLCFWTANFIFLSIHFIHKFIFLFVFFAKQALQEFLFLYRSYDIDTMVTHIAHHTSNGIVCVSLWVCHFLTLHFICCVNIWLFNLELVLRQLHWNEHHLDHVTWPPYIL